MHNDVPLELRYVNRSCLILALFLVNRKLRNKTFNKALTSAHGTRMLLPRCCERSLPKPPTLQEY